jgi:hypothetical protein
VRLILTTSGDARGHEIVLKRTPNKLIREGFPFTGLRECRPIPTAVMTELARQAAGRAAFFIRKSAARPPTGHS